MKMRKLIDRPGIVAERVNLEASARPDARTLFLQAQARQQAAESGVLFDEAQVARS